MAGPASALRAAATAAAICVWAGAVSGCASIDPDRHAAPRPPAPASVESVESVESNRGDAESASLAPSQAADALLSGLSRLCGQAFAGEVEIDTPAPAASAFAGKPLVMHVRECRTGAVRVPFHVGDDRSRTWVFTRTAAGLRLKHDHRHADGAPDAITLYGGDAAAARAGGAPGLRVEFPVDAESMAMFQAGGLTASLRNTWAAELSERRFVYELARPDGRLFRVVFDLTRPVPPPPAPWGDATEG